MFHTRSTSVGPKFDSGVWSSFSTWQCVWGWLALHPTGMYWHTLEVKNPSLVPPITAESHGTTLPPLMADLDSKTQQHNPTKEPATQCQHPWAGRVLSYTPAPSLEWGKKPWFLVQEENVREMTGTARDSTGLSPSWRLKNPGGAIVH